MKNLIQQLTEISSPSGREEKIRKCIQEHIRPHVDQIQIDTLGNIIAFKKGGGGKKLLLDAHMDEIGFLVSHIDDQGFLRVEPVGGHQAIKMPNQRLRFEHGAIGCFSYESEELSKLNQDYQQVSFDRLFVDIGAISRNDALSKVRIGEMATFYPIFTDLGKRVMSKAMDDRIGCAILIELIKQCSQPWHDIYLVFAIQEEVGLVGAGTAAYGIEPDLAIALDITATGFRDTPKGQKRIPMKLGDGPAIKIQDRSMIADCRINHWISQTADEYRIPYQYEVLPFGGTDAAAIQTSKSGVIATTLSIPTRYGHGPCEMIDIDDANNAVLLLSHLVKRPFEG
jgi:putative aminopeptidase FrvX